MPILACLALVLPVTEALSRNDCTSFALTPSEERMVQMYCTRNAVISNQIVFGHPGDNHKFLVCTDVAAGCSGTCQNGAVFDNTAKSCGSAPVSCTLPSGADSNIPLQPLEPMITNPCNQAGLRSCFLFNHNMKNRFIICDRATTTDPKVGQCMSGFVFNFNRQVCEREQSNIITCNNVINPCKPIPITQKIIDAHLLYFGCKDDPTKFIQCDRWGKMTVKQCQNKTTWSQNDLACGGQ